MQVRVLTPSSSARSATVVLVALRQEGFERIETQHPTRPGLIAAHPTNMTVNGMLIPTISLTKRR